MGKSKIINFFKKILGNTNKKEWSDFGDSSMRSFSATMEHLTESELLKIPDFYSALDLVCNAVASASINDTEIKYVGETSFRTNVYKKNSIWNLLLGRNPNQFMSKTEFFKSSMMNYFIRGGFYWYIGVNEANDPIELIPIDPNLIKKVKIENNEFAYEMEGNLAGVSGEQKKLIIPYDWIISCEYSDFTRVSDKSMVSIYSTLFQQLGLKNRYDTIQLKQSPRILAHVKSPDNLTPENLKKIRDNISKFFEGAKNLDKSAVFVGDPKLDVEFLGNNGTKIESAVATDFNNILMVKLANALHIPLPKLNIVLAGQGYYKSREGFNIDFLKEAVAPILQKIIDKLNHIVYPEDEDSAFVFDYNSLMKHDRATQSSWINNMRQNGILTTNELRHEAGFPSIDEGNTILGNGTLTDIKNNSKKDESNENIKKENDE